MLRSGSMVDEDKAPPEAVAEPVRTMTYDMKRSSRGGLGLGKPKVTESLLRVTKEVREEIRRWLPVYEEYEDQRPKTRGDCVGGARPCPWVSCKYNNYLDVKTTGKNGRPIKSKEGSSIVFNFPDTEPEDIPPERSCSLDIADQGGATLEDVAKLMNLTRERVRQVQTNALVNAEAEMLDAGVIDESDRPAGGTAQQPVESSVLSRRSFRNSAEPEVVAEEVVPSLEDTTDGLTLIDGDSLSFFSQHPNADHIVTSRVYRIYTREIIEKGFLIRPKSDRQKKLEAGGAEPLVDLPLPVAMTPRHNGVMATKKTSQEKTKRNLGNLNDRESKVLSAYTTLRTTYDRVPNNQEIAKATQLSVAQVGHARKTLVKSRLAKPSPRGKTPELSIDNAVDDALKKMKTEKTKSKKKGKGSALRGLVKVQPEHQQLPDDAMQSAAEVLALPRGPLADAANAIRNEIINLDAQLVKLKNALHALGALS